MQIAKGKGGAEIRKYIVPEHASVHKRDRESMEYGSWTPHLTGPEFNLLKPETFLHLSIEKL